MSNKLYTGEKKHNLPTSYTGIYEASLSEKKEVKIINGIPEYVNFWSSILEEKKRIEQEKIDIEYKKLYDKMTDKEKEIDRVFKWVINDVHNKGLKTVDEVMTDITKTCYKLGVSYESIKDKLKKLYLGDVCNLEGIVSGLQYNTHILTKTLKIKER